MSISRALKPTSIVTYLIDGGSRASHFCSPARCHTILSIAQAIPANFPVRLLPKARAANANGAISCAKPAIFVPPTAQSD